MTEKPKRGRKPLPDDQTPQTIWLNEAQRSYYRSIDKELNDKPGRGSVATGIRLVAEQWLRHNEQPTAPSSKV